MAAESAGISNRKPLTDDPAGPFLIQAGAERIFRFEPPDAGRPRAEVLLIHGLTGHPGRRFTTARLIAQTGFAVTLFDLAGHGGRQEPVEISRNVYRIYAQSDDARAILSSLASEQRSCNFRPRQYARMKTLRAGRHREQIDFVLDRVLRKEGAPTSLPLFVIGFSLGGLLAVDAILRRPHDPSDTGFRPTGAILLSPALRPRGRPAKTFEDALADIVWSGRKRPFSPLRLLVKGALRLNLRLNLEWSAEHMSDEEAEVELYRRDPLLFKAMPSAYAGSIEALMTIVDRQAEMFPVDSLFLFPEHDGITSVRGGLEFARRVETTRGSQSCRLVEFEGLDAHDLTRSSVRDDVHATILDWLDCRAGS